MNLTSFGDPQPVNMMRLCLPCRMLNFCKQAQCLAGLGQVCAYICRHAVFPIDQSDLRL